MLSARSFCSVVALGLTLLIEPLAYADYACNAFSLDIAMEDHNPFIAEVVRTTWQISVDGSRKQTSSRVVVHGARNGEGGVAVKAPVSLSSQEALEKNRPDFWYTRISIRAG